MGDIADLVDVENIAEKLEYLYGTKQEIADAINEVGESQGISVDSADTFRSYADKIRALGKCEVGKISVRTTPEYDEEIGKCQTFEAPEGKVWKEVKVHIDAWSAVTDEVDPLIISENGYFDVNEVSASKFDFSEVQNPTGNPKQKGYYIRINGKYYPTEDTEVEPGRTYYVKDGTKEYETASSFIINVQRQGAAPFTCEFLDEEGHVIETHNDIPYGGWCNYEGVIPTSKTGLAFQGWNPAPNNIQSNRKCQPRFYSPRKSIEEWPESWAEIVMNHGENMPIGAWKTLPLTDNKVTVYGHDVTINEYPMMMKVYNGEGSSTSTFLSWNLVFNFAQDPIVPFGFGADWDNSKWRIWTDNDPLPDGANQRINIRNFLNKHFIGIVPDYIRQFIVPVIKYTTCALTDSSEYSKLYETQDYIWIPSTREMNVDIISSNCWDGHYNNIHIKADRGPIYSDAFPDAQSRLVYGDDGTRGGMEQGLRDSLGGGGGYTSSPTGHGMIYGGNGYQPGEGAFEFFHATSCRIGFCL